MYAKAEEENDIYNFIYILIGINKVIGLREKCNLHFIQ